MLFVSFLMCSLTCTIPLQSFKLSAIVPAVSAAMAHLFGKNRRLKKRTPPQNKPLIQTACWSPNQHFIAFSSAKHGRYIWNLHDNTYNLLQDSEVYPHWSPEEYDITWSPCSMFLAASHQPLSYHELSIWRAPTGEKIQEFVIDATGDDSPIIAIGWSPCGKKIVAYNQKGVFVTLISEHSNKLYDIAVKS